MRVARGIAGLLGFWALGFLVVPLRADEVLTEAVQSWLDERDHWAFTQTVREFGKNDVKRERVERYDPSRPDRERWELLEKDGRPATPEEREAWSKRKNRKPRKHTSPLAEYLDFRATRLVDENSQQARYEVPLRSNIEWLFPVDKVVLRLTVDKATKAIRNVEATISEPFRVALGLAKVLDLQLDVDTELPTSDVPPDADAAAAQPSGTARVLVTKFGDRVEYSWRDFVRVTPHPSRKP